MQAYGVKRQDNICCPGCSKYPQDYYLMTSKASRKRKLRHAKKSARMLAKKEIREVYGVVGVAVTRQIVIL